MSTSNVRPVLAITGASTARSPSTPATWPCRAWPTSPAPADRDGGCAATSSVSARPRSVGRLRSCTSSNTTSPTPGNSGSCCSRRVRTPFGDDLEPGSPARSGARRGSGSRRSHRPPRRAAPPSAAPQPASPAAAVRASRSCRRPTTPRRAAPAARVSSCRLQAGRRGPPARSARSASRTRSNVSKTGRSASGGGRDPPRTQPAARRTGNGPGSPAIGIIGALQ